MQRLLFLISLMRPEDTFSLESAAREYIFLLNAARV
jgi:hypothetical protein